MLLLVKSLSKTNDSPETILWSIGPQNVLSHSRQSYTLPLLGAARQPRPGRHGWPGRCRCPGRHDVLSREKCSHVQEDMVGSRRRPGETLRSAQPGYQCPGETRRSIRQGYQCPGETRFWVSKRRHNPLPSTELGTARRTFRASW